MPRSSVLRRSLLGLLAATLVATAVQVAAPASAAVRVPATPKGLHPGVDAYSSYEPETSCSVKPKPGVVAWRDALIRTYGTRWNNISRACSASQSGHEEGRALDYGNLATNATQKAQADAIFGWLFATDAAGNPHAMARRLGIQYIQYNNKMWRAYNAPAGWQPQMVSGKDCAKLGSGYKTTCHRDHIHFSFSWAGANKKTSYFTGAVACPTPPTQPTFSTVPTNLTAVPVTPVRVFTSLAGVGGCRLQAKNRLDVRVTGVGGVPSTGVGAVALNVTGVRATAATYLSAYPAGTAWPKNSTVNVPAGGTAAATVIVPVGSNGRVSIRSSHAPVDVNVDVVGYFPTASTGSTYTPTAPQTLLDTRTTTVMAAKEHRKVQVTGRFGVPAGATGALVNVTATSTGPSGNVGVSSAFGTVVGTSTVYFGKGVSISNRALTALAADGTIEVYATSQSHVRVDLVGWFGHTDGLRYNPVLPRRVLDTRYGTGGVATLTSPDAAEVLVAGSGNVPADAQAVVGTLTVIRPSVAANATIWRDGSAKPGIADLSLPAGSVRETLVSPVLSADGKAALAVAPGTSDAALDVLGYFR